MDTVYYESVLEHFHKRPYSALVYEATNSGACREIDLIEQGRQILRDLARLARGEISEILVPNRLPYPGEYASAR